MVIEYKGYLISELGLVTTAKGKVVKKHYDKNGFSLVYLKMENGGYKKYRLDKLILELFNVVNPKNYNFVAHKNGINNDDRLLNLTWSYTECGNLEFNNINEYIKGCRRIIRKCKKEFTNYKLDYNNFRTYYYKQHNYNQLQYLQHQYIEVGEVFSNLKGWEKKLKKLAQHIRYSTHCTNEQIDIYNQLYSSYVPEFEKIEEEVTKISNNIYSYKLNLDWGVELTLRDVF